MHPKDRAGPPRVTEESDNQCEYRGRGCAKEDNCRQSGASCALAKYFNFLVLRPWVDNGLTDTSVAWTIARTMAEQLRDDTERCRFEPGGKECGCPVVGTDNMLPACDGSFESYVGYGNQENFGGGQLRVDMWHDRGWPAEDFPIPPPSAIRDRDPTEHILSGWNEEPVAPVTAYEAGGKIYRDRSDAVRATTERAFLEWYEDNTLYRNYEGCKGEARDMLEWIKENRHALAKLLKTMV